MKLKKREKVLLFYNPYSGNGLFKNNLDLIVDLFQMRNFQVIPVRSAREFPIGKVLGEINPEEYRQIIVAGGDGTINICVNFMIQHNINLPLAIFPTGTANDFAYCFDLPAEIEKMAEVAMGETTTYADVGMCNDRCFINVAALGNIVDVSQKTDSNLKNTLGIFSYYLKGVAELKNLKPLPVRLKTDANVYEENMFFMLVMNGKSAGGFKKISPKSKINDGLLDVILFREMQIMEMGPLLVDVLQGKHPKHKNVLAFETDNLIVESAEKISTDIDGEVGDDLPLTFKVLHHRLKIYTSED